MRHTPIDFTQGSIPKKMLLFSWPIFLGNMLQSSYQIIDSLWVGNLLGANQLGAVVLSTTIIFTVLSFIIGINSATLTVLSQYRGANDDNGLQKALNAFVVVLGLLSVLLGLAGIVVTPWLLGLLGTPAGIFDDAQTYLQINFLGIVFLFGYNFIGTVLRALGDSKTPVRFIVLAVVLNGLLSPLLIGVFGWGIHGAALSTIAAQTIAFIYGLLFCLRRAEVPFSRPTWPERIFLKKVINFGIPGGLQMMAISAGVLAIMSVVTSFGEDVVAGFGAAHRIESLIILPAITLGSAVNSMAGQNIGAGLMNRVSLITRTGITVIVIVSLLISAVIFFSADFLLRLFVDDADTVGFGAGYLRTIAFFYPFLCLNFVMNGVLRAAGAMFQVLALNLASFWILRYPLTYAMAHIMGREGIAYGIGISLIISSVLAGTYYLFGGWRSIKVIERKPAGQADS